MSLVIDASVTLAWLFEDGDTERVSQAMRQATALGAFVPSLWRLEVANVLQASVRRGRTTIAFRDRSLSDLDAMAIVIDDETDQRAWSATLRLAERHGLTLYDAAYLELADRRALPLASLDTALCAAAAAVGVRVC